MIKYLLDTHIILWLLEDSDDLNKAIKEDIDYFQYPYYVSVESLREIVILQSLQKISLEYTLDKIIAILQKKQINILSIKLEHIQWLENLPVFKGNGKEHNDPFDRMLIAQAIADKLTIVSADKKFPFYRQAGLKLLVNDV